MSKSRKPSSRREVHIAITDEVLGDLLMAASRPVLPLLPGEEGEPDEIDKACEEARSSALLAYLIREKKGGETLSKAAHHVLNCEECRKFEHLSKFLKKFL